jgi:hypothetical protein
VLSIIARRGKPEGVRVCEAVFRVDVMEGVSEALRVPVWDVVRVTVIVLLAVCVIDGLCD